MDKPKKIIVIEDDPILSKALNIELVGNGFDVVSSENGEKGLCVVLAEHPDLILLDLVMPKMDGMTMLEKLRDNPWGRTVPVIILTNLSSADEKRNKDITKLEPTYYFMKTEIRLEELVEKIKEKLKML